MLDLKRIRQDPEAVRRGLASKSDPDALANLQQLLQADAVWRSLLARAEALRAERNRISRSVGQARREEGSVPAELWEASRRLAEELRALEAELAPAEQRVQQLLLLLPNLPDPAVPPGPDASANREVRRGGDPPRFPFAPAAHWDIGPALGVLDFERAAKLSGSRFTVFRGRGAALVRALQALMIDMHVREHGCTEVLPPFVVNSASMQGTGNLPKFASDAFAVRDADLWLVPTAEVPVTNLYRDEILSGEQLPIRHVAYTPCWRSEAGAAGRDTRGLIRQHQFDKVEIVHFVRPEDSAAHLEEIVRCAEAVLQRLELPYRVVELCTGDMGFSQAHTYDLEVWMPSYNSYVEISSCSDYGDFQARRCGIRFRRAPGAPLEYVHTLNGSALAIGRTVAALLENGQTADGRVQLPSALAPYLGHDLLWGPTLTA